MSPATMNASIQKQSMIESPRDLPAPRPHLPLRKASAQRLHSRRGAPKPLFVPAQHHQVRGFSPSSVQPAPRLADVTASTEHAFAGRDARRSAKLPLGVQAMKHGQETRNRGGRKDWSPARLDENDGRPPSSPLLPPVPSPKPKSLRNSKSLGGGIKGLRRRLSSTNGHAGARRDGGAIPPKGTRPMRESSASRPSMTAGDGFRFSFRSAVTSDSSLRPSSSAHTAHSSLNTGNSSQSEFVNVYPDWPDTEDADGDMTVDDAIGMYEYDHESAKPSMETTMARPLSADQAQPVRPASQPGVDLDKPRRPNMAHRRSQSATLLTQWKTSNPIAPPKSSSNVSQNVHPLQQPQNHPVAVPRDRYGFKKASQHITVAQYDSWDVRYSEHLERRRKKWQALMRSYGLSVDDPFRFPPKSDKIKRYVRKGIPSNLRGAAWFWYAGGPGRMAKEPNLYRNLLQQIEHGKLSDNDREHIERDLNRTFPDNVKFKPDATTTSDILAGAGGGNKRETTEREQPIVQSLRRVLQAFAVHNPKIGYCQSLNFIAGLLLIFLDQDEEKSFTLLNIVTSTHLPGTHGLNLEGANVDIAVLCACIKDSLPGIWSKIDDQGGNVLATDSAAPPVRLPTISLATTAWFMSLFVGTLPIESVLRVWDCLFFEGSKTLFRIALAIFKAGERQIMAVSDPMEIFQVVQTIPRGMLDINGLMEVCFRRRGGFGHVSQELIERRREEGRHDVRAGIARVDTGPDKSWRGRLRRGTRL
nr:gtpase-activating protein gyp3 [Quercus suber]